MQMILCRLSHVLIEEQSDSQVVFLTEQDGERRLPIVIGPLEAGAIARAIKGERFERPLTHDLIVNVLGACDHTLTEIRIVSLQDGVFYAELVLAAADGTEALVDCRPSDALALAARVPDTPIFVADQVFDAALD